MKTPDERLAVLETKVDNIEKDLDSAIQDLKEYKKHVSDKYAKKKLVDEVKKTVRYISKTFVGTVISIIIGIVVFYLTKK